MHEYVDRLTAIVGTLAQSPFIWFILVAVIVAVIVTTRIEEGGDQ